MEERKSGLWWYLLVVWFAFLTIYTIGKMLHMEDVMQMPTIYISFWKLGFVVMLLSSFARARQQEKKTGLGFLILAGILVLEILYCTGLFVCVFWRKQGLSMDFCALIFHRILYAHGIAGIAGAFFGTVCGRVVKSRFAYVCVALLAMCGADFMESYNYDVWNENPYNPYPVRGIFRLADASAAGTGNENVLVLRVEDYDAAARNVSVRFQQMELWINQEHLFEASVEMELEAGHAEEMVLCLNRVMTVDSVMDDKGNMLEWERKGHYVCVKGACERIWMHYYCDESSLLAIDGDYVSLPAYVMYYPTGLEESCAYQVVVHGRGRIYCNLPELGENAYGGQAATVSMLGGKMIAETRIGDIRIIYPVIRYDSEKIKNIYKYMIVVNAKDHLEGKDWFVDETLGRYYGGNYRTDVIQTENYLFGQRR